MLFIGFVIVLSLFLAGYILIANLIIKSLWIDSERIIYGGIYSVLFGFGIAFLTFIFVGKASHPLAYYIFGGFASTALLKPDGNADLRISVGALGGYVIIYLSSGTNILGIFNILCS